MSTTIVVTFPDRDAAADWFRDARRDGVFAYDEGLAEVALTDELVVAAAGEPSYLVEPLPVATTSSLVGGGRSRP